MSRKREQTDLIFKAGQVFGPMLKVFDNPTAFDNDEKIRTYARYQSDMPRLVEAAMKFCKSEPGHEYLAQFNQVHEACYRLNNQSQVHGLDSPTFQAEFRKSAERVAEVIVSIPVPIDSAIYEARTPFSTYCLVKDLCSTTKREIIWLDRYFDQGIFHRYFTDVPSNVLITLVTWPQSECKGAKDKQRYQEFMDVSKLFAQERGPDGYRLVTNNDFHDRWLCCDDKLFTLGGSIKDIAKESTFTISRLDSTPENRKHFDDAINLGTEVFGKSLTTHL